MTQPPESVQPVEGEGGMDAERQPLSPFIGPSQVGVLQIGNEVAACKIAVAVHLEAETCGERLGERVVVGEVDAPEPQAVLPFDDRWVGAADLILMPLE